MILNQRGAHFASDSNIPDKQTYANGMEQLESYLNENSGIIEPKVDNGDYSNILMLYYFRNPMNQVFFNESLILVAMHSFGLEKEWQQGVDREQLI